MKKTQHGITLIDMLTAITILALLAAIAYPVYTSYIRKARLQNVRATLLQNSQDMERYYAQHHKFTGFSATVNDNDYFTVSVESADEVGYLLKAAPKNSSETCSVFLNSNGLFYAVETGKTAETSDCPGF